MRAKKKKNEGRRKEPQGERKAVAGDSEGSEVGDGAERIAEEGRPRREVHVDRQRLRERRDGARCYGRQGPELRGSSGDRRRVIAVVSGDEICTY